MCPVHMWAGRIVSVIFEILIGVVRLSGAIDRIAFFRIYFELDFFIREIFRIGRILEKVILLIVSIYEFRKRLGYSKV